MPIEIKSQNLLIISYIGVHIPTYFCECYRRRMQLEIFTQQAFPIVDVDRSSHPHLYLPKFVFDHECIGQHFSSLGHQARNHGHAHGADEAHAAVGLDEGSRPAREGTPLQWARGDLVLDWSSGDSDRASSSEEEGPFPRVQGAQAGVTQAEAMTNLQTHGHSHGLPPQMRFVPTFECTYPLG